MANYYTCSCCGANLDPGERCDCKRENIAQYSKDTMGKAQISQNEKYGQSTQNKKGRGE